MKAAVYANGSSDIGLGHIMRTLAISRELQKNNFSIEYLTDKSDNGAINLIKNYGFNVIVLDDILNYIVNNKMPLFDLAIVDDYDIDEYELENFYNISNKVVYIDDLTFFKNYNMDILINTSIGALNKKYIGTAIKLLGPRYAILRDEFKGLKYKIPTAKIKTILITLGGGDINNITKNVLDVLLENYKDIKYNVILGNSYKYKDFMIQNYTSPNVNFLKNVKNMREIVKKCDLAISAGGNTLYELCACSLPTIALITAMNQKQFVMEIHKKTGMDFIDLSQISFKNIKNRFEYIVNKNIENYEFRLKVSKKMFELVDGQGCKRIVDQIIKLF